METLGTGWCCSDCLFLLANDETPVDMTIAETENWLANITRRADGLDIVVGGEHSYSDGCRNVDEDGTWIGDTDCDCETISFSSSSCDTCGSHLGGSRHAVTYFKKETK